MSRRSRGAHLPPAALKLAPKEEQPAPPAGPPSPARHLLRVAVAVFVLIHVGALLRDETHIAIAAAVAAYTAAFMYNLSGMKEAGCTQYAANCLVASTGYIPFVASYLLPGDGPRVAMNAFANMSLVLTATTFLTSQFFPRACAKK